MKLTPKTSEIIRRAMGNEQGDNLERAERAFRGLNYVQLQEQHGMSGKTRAEILEGYRLHRREHMAAMKELEPFLS